MKYDADVDLNNENNSHTLLVKLVGHDKRVLDVGCATGYLGRALKEWGCVVKGIEIDAAAADKARSVIDDVVVGDLEELDLESVFGTERFDVIVFGDVLEHLREPLALLRRATPLLTTDGSVVASIPNVAHGAVRLALLKGEFRYREFGLLDDTHFRLFTRDSIEELFAAAGMTIVEMERTTAGLFETELGLQPQDFPDDLLALVELQPEVETYQFVVRALMAHANEADALRRTRHEIQQAEAAHRRSALFLNRGGDEIVRRARCRVGLLTTVDLDRPRDDLVTRLTKSELQRRLPGAAVGVLAPLGPLHPVSHDGGEVVIPVAPFSAAKTRELAEQFDALVIATEVSTAARLAIRYGDDAATMDHPASIVATGLPPDLEAGCRVIYSGVTLDPAMSVDELRGLELLRPDRRGLTAVVDEAAAARLRSMGAHHVVLVPDVAFLAPRIFPSELLLRRQAFLRHIGWLPDSPFVFVHCGDDPAHVVELAKGLARLMKRRKNASLVLADFDSSNDRSVSDELADALPVATTRLPFDASLDDMVAAIAGSETVISTSPTPLAISSSFGVPMIGVALASPDTLRGFDQTTGGMAPVVTRAEDLPTVFDRLPERAHLLAVVAGIQALLDTHFDTVARQILDTTEWRAYGSRDLAFLASYRDALATAHRALQAQLRTGRALLPAIVAPPEETRLQPRAIRLEQAVEHLRSELDAVYQTRTFKVLRPARALYARVRGRQL